MFKKLYSIVFTILFSFLFISTSNAQFYDNFDSYTAGQMLACQNPTGWTTWSGVPCTVGEDALVSNAQSFSAPNSVIITSNNDLVRLHGNVTTGKWYQSFRMYIPAGKSGYFNMLSNFTFGTGGYWVFECYFDVGGGGRLQTGDPVTNFTWTPGTWQWVEVVIDLNTDLAELWIGGIWNGTLVKSWAWTNGTSTGTGTLNIAATDFFGAATTDEMYFDDYWFGPNSGTPVELTSFTASVNPNGQAVLNWVTATEINNRGFEVERRAANGQFATIGFVEGFGTTAEEKSYSFVDGSVYPGIYVYRLKQVDFNGQFEYSGEVELDVTPPLAFGLVQNYPNPFNPSTKIEFSLKEAGNVKLAIYNTLGEEVSVLVNGPHEAGFFDVEFDAANLPSGTYIYRLEAPGFVEARKMILMK